MGVSVCEISGQRGRWYVGKRIQYFRERYHWTREKLAVEMAAAAKILRVDVGASHNTVRRLEHGESHMQIEVLMSVALALQVSLADLCGDVLSPEHEDY